MYLLLLKDFWYAFMSVISGIFLNAQQPLQASKNRTLKPKFIPQSSKILCWSRRQINVILTSSYFLSNTLSNQATVTSLDKNSSLEITPWLTFLGILVLKEEYNYFFSFTYSAFKNPFLTVWSMNSIKFCQYESEKNQVIVLLVNLGSGLMC